MVANDGDRVGYLKKSVGDMFDKGMIIDEQLTLVRAHSARRATRKNESLDMIHHELRLKTCALPPIATYHASSMSAKEIS